MKVKVFLTKKHSSRRLRGGVFCLNMINLCCRRAAVSAIPFNGNRFIQRMYFF